MTVTERHAPYRVPHEEVDLRLASLQSALQADDLALAWIDHRSDRLYFGGSVQDGLLLVPARGRPVFYVRKSVGRARAESPVEVREHPGRRALVSEVRQRAGERGRIGLAMDVTPAATLLWLQHNLAQATPVDVARTVRTIRSVKRPWEVEQIRQAARQATTVFREVPAWLRPGLTELEATARVEGRLRELGHAGTVRVRRPGADLSVSTIVSGGSARYPTDFPGPVGAEGPDPAGAGGGGWKRLASGESVMFDIVTSHNGYLADNTRTFVLGATVPDVLRRAHDFCREVLSHIESLMQPGACCAEIHRETRRFAESRGEPEGFMGYGENRVRFFGHGVGLELDELPVLAEKIDMRLAPGTILAVEPKAFLENPGPAGVENTYLVTERGCESLCEADEDLLAV